MAKSARNKTGNLEDAQKRLTAALRRIEVALDARTGPNLSGAQNSSEENMTIIAELESEIKKLRGTNSCLENANRNAQEKVNSTITRLRSILEG